ncbi:hypothetical protein CDAR_168751 [Caerostris darwini]|uniref:Uncharacterized protein n=1 Tax=Caerostris darwini TaxID=1538125 RepID=A0AAV4WNX5_9ARAC|nr:hypothetical protein CDAR_168751 [Caerostris darwini]
MCKQQIRKICWTTLNFIGCIRIDLWHSLPKTSRLHGPINEVASVTPDRHQVTQGWQTMTRQLQLVLLTGIAPSVLPILHSTPPTPKQLCSALSPCTCWAAHLFPSCWM